MDGRPECELRLSKRCKGYSETYSGLADRNGCEPCVGLFVERHWAGRIPKGSTVGSPTAYQPKKEDRMAKKSASWKEGVAELVEETVPMAGEKPAVPAATKAEVKIINEASSPETFVTIMASKDGESFKQISYTPVTAEEATQKLQKAEKRGYTVYKLVVDAKAESAVAKSEGKKEAKKMAKAAKAKGKSAKAAGNGLGRRATFAIRTKTVADILKDRKPHDISALAKAIKTKRCVKTLELLKSECGLKLEVDRKEGVVRQTGGTFKPLSVE